jgi:predicted dehydrogenase
VYADTATLLRNHRPDAVLVTSSDDAHAELTLAALEAGAHVLVEKPISKSLRSAAAMCSAAEAADRLLVTTCNKRYSPPYAEARHLLDRGAVPRPALFSAKFVLGYEYVDLLPSGTIHVFDLARHFMGDVRQLSAVSAAANGGIVVMLEFASGAIGSVVTSAAALSLHPWERVEIFGEHAWLEVDDQLTLTLHAGEYEPGQVWSPAVPSTLVSAEEWGGYVGMLETFLAGVRGEATELDPFDGYRAFELVVATILSLERRAPVGLPLDGDAAE